MRVSPFRIVNSQRTYFVRDECNSLCRIGLQFITQISGLAFHWFECYQGGGISRGNGDDRRGETDKTHQRLRPPVRNINLVVARNPPLVRVTNMVPVCHCQFRTPKPQETRRRGCGCTATQLGETRLAFGAVPKPGMGLECICRRGKNSQRCP